MEAWNATHPPGPDYVKPKVAYLTNDSFGRTLLTPEMDAYLNKTGYELVLPAQIVPSVPTTPPEAAFEFLKTNNISLCLGAHTCIGSVPLMKWAYDRGIGWNLTYNVTFGFCSPSHLAVFLRDGERPKGEGLVVAGSYPGWNDTCPGIQFCNYLQERYRPTEKTDHIMYAHGVVEAMIQVEALRLALDRTGKSPDDLTTHDVLYEGFFQIKNLDTGGIIPTPISYAVGDVEGADGVVLHQVQNWTQVELGVWPLRHVYAGA